LTPIVRVCCRKLMLAATCTVFLSPKKPAAEALMSADPRLTPVTVGCWAGVVCPCAIVTLDGEIVTLEVSLLTRSMVTPLTGAPVTRLTGNDKVWPGPTLTFESSVIAPSMATVTLAVPVLKPGAPARMVVEPRAAPVAVNVPLVAPAAIALWPAGR